MLQHSWLRVSTASSWTTIHTLIIVEHLFILSLKKITLTATRAIVQHWVAIFLRLSIIKSYILVVWLATITAVGWLPLVGSMQERSHWEESEESAQLSRCLTDHLNSKAATNNASISILTVCYLHCILQYLCNIKQHYGYTFLSSQVTALDKRRSIVRPHNQKHTSNKHWRDASSTLTKINNFYQIKIIIMCL